MELAPVAVITEFYELIYQDLKVMHRFGIKCTNVNKKMVRGTGCGEMSCGPAVLLSCSPSQTKLSFVPKSLRLPLSPSPLLPKIPGLHRDNGSHFYDFEVASCYGFELTKFIIIPAWIGSSRDIPVRTVIGYKHAILFQSFQNYLNMWREC
jgi:hypothetical protein